MVNAASRRGAEAFPIAMEALPRYGVDLDTARAVTDPSTIPDIVREAVMSRARLLVVGGGDGTISCAAGVLADLPAQDRPVLGVLPLGTANDFARSLEIPKGSRLRVRYWPRARSSTSIWPGLTQRPS